LTLRKLLVGFPIRAIQREAARRFPDTDERVV